VPEDAWLKFMTSTCAPFNYLAIFLGAALLVGLLAAPTPAQNRSATPYCFAVKDTLSVFARPANNAATGDRYNRGDIAYATTHPPTAVVQGRRSFIQVAIYGGNKAWAPQRSTIDGAPILMDLSTDQCSNPPAHAAGGRR
jgi:hypothetical protein